MQPKLETRLKYLEDIALILLCIYILSNNIMSYVFKGSIFNTIYDIGMIALIIFMCAIQRRQYINSSSGIIFINIVFMIITVLISDNLIRESICSRAHILKYFYFAFLIATRFNSKDRRYIIDSMYLNNLIVLFIIIFRKEIFLNGEKEINYLGTIINTNAIPYLIGFGYIISVHKSIYATRKMLHCSFMLLFISVLIFTKSSAAFIIAFSIPSVFLFELIVKNFSIYRKVKLKKVVECIIICLMIFLIIYSAYELLPKNILSRVTRLDDNGRFELFARAFRFYRQGNILFGNGFDMLRYVSINYDGYGCHNLFINLLVSHGIIGLALNAFLILTVILKTRSSIVYCGMVIVVVGAMVEGGMAYYLSNILLVCAILANNKELPESHKSK